MFFYRGKSVDSAIFGILGGLLAVVTVMLLTLLFGIARWKYKHRNGFKGENNRMYIILFKSRNNSQQPLAEIT